MVQMRQRKSYFFPLLSLRLDIVNICQMDAFQFTLFRYKIENDFHKAQQLTTNLGLKPCISFSLSLIIKRFFLKHCVIELSWKRENEVILVFLYWDDGFFFKWNTSKLRKFCRVLWNLNIQANHIIHLCIILHVYWLYQMPPSVQYNGVLTQPFISRNAMWMIMFNFAHHLNQTTDNIELYFISSVQTLWKQTSLYLTIFVHWIKKHTHTRTVQQICTLNILSAWIEVHNEPNIIYYIETMTWCALFWALHFLLW